jgi:hypothetical protein
MVGRAGRIQNQCASFLRARRPLAAEVGKSRCLEAGDDALARRRHVRAASGGGAWQSGVDAVVPWALACVEGTKRIVSLGSTTVFGGVS